MPFRILKDKKGYFVENIETGKKFSKKPMTEQNAIKQFKILNKYLHTLEGSGINKGEANQIAKEALTDADIKKYLPNVKIVSHQELKNYKTIDELMPHKNDIVIIIWESKRNFGHWTILLKYIDDHTHKPTIEYTDPYGFEINEPLKWIKEKRIDSTPYLTKLLQNAKNKYDIIWNSKDFQKESKSISTCGRHCIMRGLTNKYYNQSLTDYIKMMNELKDVTGFNYDQIVSSIIDI